MPNLQRFSQRAGNIAVTRALRLGVELMAVAVLVAILTTQSNRYEIITMAAAADARFGSALRELRMPPSPTSIASSISVVAMQ